MNNELLLSKLERLVDIDRSVSFDSQNPNIYRQRALLLQELGANTLAKYDNRICAFLEKKEDIEYYNHSYKILLTEAEFQKCYKNESQTHYYKLFFDILQNDKALSEDVIDPIHFALRSGNLKYLGLFNLSLRDCNDAMQHLKPFPQEYAIATLNKALLLNLVGNYEDGWRLYEERWNTHYKSFQNPITFNQPKWQGEPIDKGCLLIHSEQGIGDNIQFIRYAIYLKELGFDILVWNNALIDDFLTFNLRQYNIQTIKNSDNVTFTHWISMMSLPYLCNSTLDNIPLKEQYLFSSTEYLRKWQKEQSLTSQKLKIGVVWQGGKNTDTDTIRSIPLSLFSQLFQVNAEFYCLQKEITLKDMTILNQYTNVHYWHNEIESFMDTSAIIEQMDLVISVDTSVAHLSAAMGKTTWILLHYSPDFRWLYQGENSIWYDSVRLFRQKLDYDWKPVIQQVKDELHRQHLVISQES